MSNYVLQSTLAASSAFRPLLTWPAGRKVPDRVLRDAIKRSIGARLLDTSKTKARRFSCPPLLLLFPHFIPQKRQIKRPSSSRRKIEDASHLQIIMRC